MPANSLHNEKELLNRIADGDEDAFTSIFNYYSPRVMHVAMLFTHSVPISEDIVQDVFMKVWLKRRELISIIDFNNWIFIIARNLSINVLSKIARKEVSYEALPDYMPAFDNPANAELDAKYLESHIRNAIQLLTGQQQKVFELAKLKGMNREEIGRTLGLSPNTVKMHLVRSTRFVRAYLLAKGDHLQLF